MMTDKTDLHGVERQLKRIASALERIVYHLDQGHIALYPSSTTYEVPVPLPEEPDDLQTTVAFPFGIDDIWPAS